MSMPSEIENELQIVNADLATAEKALRGLVLGIAAMKNQDPEEKVSRRALAELLEPLLNATLRVSSASTSLSYAVTKLNISTVRARPY